MSNKELTMFSKRLKELRIENNLTQEQLAKLLFVNRVTISDWEIRGKEPSYITLVKLVKILNTTADYLLGITDYDF